MVVDWYFVGYLGFIILVFPFIIVLSLWRYRTIKRLMEHQAVKRSGMVTGSFLLPQLKYSYRELPIIVTSVPGNKYRHAKTEATITLFTPATAPVTIAPESLMSRVGRRNAGADIHVGFDEFDHEFLIRSENEVFVRNLMTTVLQNTLLEMKHEKPMISIHGTWLTVSFPKILKTDEGYDHLLDLACAFVDRLTEL